MLKLVKLEFKKNNFNGNWSGVLTANIAICALIAVMYFDPGGDGIITTYEESFKAIDTFVRSVFMIFASVLLAKFIIEEFKTKTMSLMFTYPVSRKKLIAAKVLIVFLWTFIVIILSNILVMGFLLLLNSIFQQISSPLDAQLLLVHSLGILMSALAAAGMSLIPLYFGMLKKSVPATIVSSIILVSIISSSFGNNQTLNDFILVPIILAIIGISISYLSFRNIDKVDLV